MSDQPVPKASFEEQAGALWWRLVRNLVCPPLWLYRDESSAWDSMKKSWWLYASFVLMTLVVFWPGIVAGDWWLVATAPVIHVVIPALIFLSMPPPSMAPGLVEAAWMWPHSVVAVPDWVPPVELLGSLLVVPIAAGVVKRLWWPWRIASDEMVVPLSELRQRSDGAPQLPRLEQDVSTLLLGEPKSGKTSALKMLAYQFDYGGSTATIVHDFKTDYQQYYGKTDLQIERLSIDSGTVTWNLFLEPEKEREYLALAKGIIGDDPNNPFLQDAQLVLYGVMLHLKRNAAENDTVPDHAGLVRMITENDHQTLYEILDENDLPGASGLDPEARGSRNVWRAIEERTLQTFVGQFAESGSFSLREFVRNPEGRVLIIDTKQDEVDSSGRMFRLLLDQCVKFGLTSPTEVNFILDEVDQLPPMRMLSTLASAGRGDGVRTLIGIQTIGQLGAQYGRWLDGILGSCPQGVYFSPGERKTVRHVLSELGERRETETSRSESESGSGADRRHTESVSERVVERGPVSTATMKRWGSGECAVVGREDWWIGRTELLEDVRQQLDRSGAGLGARRLVEDGRDDLPETFRKKSGSD